MRSTRSRTKADGRTEQYLTSPIHKLPDELVAHIFVLGCPKPNLDRDILKPDDMADDPFPYQVLVSSIGRRWRRISLQSPTLWSFVLVMLPFKTLAMAKRYVPLMNTIIKRSGVASLTLIIKHRSPLCLRNDAVWGNPAVQNLLTNLLARAHLFKFHMSTPQRVTSQIPVFPITRDRYPHLQHLLLIVDRRASFPSILPGGLLNLQTLAYANLGPCRALSPILGSNPQHFFYASEVIDDATLAAISHLTRLEELEILTYQWTTSQSYSSTRVKRLTIQQPMDRTHAPALGDLPVLTHLTLHNPFYGSNWYATEQSRDSPTPTHSLPDFPALKTFAFQEQAHSGGGETSIQVSFQTIQNLLIRAPNLVALELWDANAFAALDYLRDSDASGSLDSVMLSDLRLLRLVIGRRYSEDLLGEIALKCEQLMEKRSGLRVEWWVVQYPGTERGLDAQCLSTLAPPNVWRHICKFPGNTPPTLRTVFDPAM